MGKLAKISTAFLLLHICFCGGGNQEDSDIRFLEDSKKDALILPGDAQMVGFEQITGPLILPPSAFNDILGEMSKTYSDYGLVSIAMANYKDIVHQNQYTVEVYKFPDSQCSFGLYTALRPRQCRIISIGAQGFIDSAQLRFLKGVYVVNISGFVHDSSYEENILKLSELTSANIDGKADLPVELSFFPVHGMIIHSERYHYEGFPGLKLPAPTFSAEYVIREMPVTVLYVSKISQKAIKDYFHYIEQNGRILAKEEFMGSDYLRLLDPGLGRMLICVEEERLFGIIGEFDPARNRDFINMLMDNLK